MPRKISAAANTHARPACFNEAGAEMPRKMLEPKFVRQCLDKLQ